VSLLYCVSFVFYFHICFILLLCDPLFLTLDCGAMGCKPTTIGWASTYGVAWEGREVGEDSWGHEGEEARWEWGNEVGRWLMVVVESGSMGGAVILIISLPSTNPFFIHFYLFLNVLFFLFFHFFN
jgi:hypothetical protein